MKYLLAFIVSTSILFTGVVGCSSPTHNITEEVVLATSDDNTILLRDFLYYFGDMKTQQEMFFTMFGLTEEDIVDFWTNDSEGMTQEQLLRQYALDHAINNATLLALAKEAGYTYDPNDLEEMEAEIDDFIAHLSTPEVRGEDAFFNMYMITPQDFKDMQRDFLTINAFVTSLAESIPVLEEDMLAFYEENQIFVEDRLNLQATVRHVLIKSDETMSEEEREAAREKADEILRRVESGEDIGELAALYSEDEGSAQNNGEYEFHRGLMQPEFEEWAFSAQSGDIGMVETEFGYHIMYSIYVDTIDNFHEELKMLIREEQLVEIISSKIEESNMEWDINEEVLNSVTVM